MAQISSPLASTPNARDYIDVMHEIRKLGMFHDFEENIPTIVVFGDQSSGKSSVLKRLTGGIPMPRGSSKCTATPFEIRMLQSDEPYRKISLRYVEDKNQEPVQPREIEYIKITGMEEQEIEVKLREAQRFVQNPSITTLEPSRLIPGTDELAFTKNTVCVTISGPDQPYSLSMVDLPGIVRDHEDHEKFVLDLVKEYIKKDSAILVPIFHSTSDIATQGAWRLSREADPTGIRTVGVLTKIDRLIDYPNDDEKHTELANLVRGRGEHQILNGTYLIRNPSSGQTESYEDPDELEKTTFRTLRQQHRAWREVPSDRFGLQNLTMKLSSLQRRAHELTWPKIRPFLEERRAEIQARLDGLPLPPDGNPTIRFLELIGNFDKEFTSHANAEHVEHRLYRGQQWNFGQFDQALRRTRPRFRLTFDDELVNEVFDPIKPGALQIGGWTDNLKIEISADEWGKTDDDHPIDSKYVWGLDRLSEIVQQSQGGQLVGYFPFKAVVSIVAKHQEDWLSISTKLLDKNYDWVVQFTNELIDKTFKEFPNAVDEIKRISRELLKSRKEDTLEHLKDLENMEHMSASRALYVTDEASILKKQAKYFIQYRIMASVTKHEGSGLREILDDGSKLYDMMYKEDSDEDEFERIKTHLINAISNRELNESSQKLIEEIRSYRILSSDIPSAATLSMMLMIKNTFLDKLIETTPQGEDSTNRKVLRKTINEQSFLAATGALAYWKMAHTKFREIVPRIVEYYLVHLFATRLGMHLRNHFNLSGKQQDEEANTLELKDILGEDPENARNRKEWNQDIDDLSAIIDKVRKVSVKNHMRR